ncbi:hypothetical protein NUW58_g1424 [Xylaria curta]|uniref:Uncharacterized protein n=1 Tax=Xylaria curta TaxID=42375 RepID=A0ACC1PL90_9PEZI|nr:hypothetical protein NUW58_g1424 [Xylaria curta]
MKASSIFAITATALISTKAFPINSTSATKAAEVASPTVIPNIRPVPPPSTAAEETDSQDPNTDFAVLHHGPHKIDEDTKTQDLEKDTIIRHHGPHKIDEGEDKLGGAQPDTCDQLACKDCLKYCGGWPNFSCYYFECMNQKCKNCNVISH